MEIDAFETLKEPAHRGPLGRFAELVGDGFVQRRQVLADAELRQFVHEQAEHHDERQRHDAFGFLEEH